MMTDDEENENEITVLETASIEKPGEIFNCELCDFKSIRKNGVTIHMSYRHRMIEQLDGAVCDDMADDEYEKKILQKYKNTVEVWRTGELGSDYQAYLDALEVINDSNIVEAEKEKERVMILEARKNALGRTYFRYRPW